MNAALGLPSSQRTLRMDALEHLANIDPLELCSEAKVEKCRATRDLRSCGRVVQHVLTSCGHASLCAECSQRCDVCPICRVPIPKHDGNLRLRIYNECLEAGLVSISQDEDAKEMEGDGQIWMEDVQRLYSLFDVALDNNLICLVCHYVTDVCMDESAVSSDAIVAMLLDGAVVKEWCKRKLLTVMSHLQDIYNLGVKEMQMQYELLSRIINQLDGVVNVLGALEGPLLDSPSLQLLEVQNLSEKVLKVKQHLEVMAWCARHDFLETLQCRYVSIFHWRNAFHEKKAAASARAWPDFLNSDTSHGCQPQATLFIEDAMSNLNIRHDYDEESDREAGELSWLQQGGGFSHLQVKSRCDGALYPPENLRAAVDLLFLEGSADLIIAKRAIFLYYLFDRHWNLPNVDWRSIVDDYAGTFGIARHLVLESLVFYLLDDNTDVALEETCRLLPEIVRSTAHPKIARVLLERQSPDAALMVLRCSGCDGQSGVAGSCYQEGGVASLPEAVTAVRVRLECGLLTEAYLYQKTHCLRVKTEQSKHTLAAVTTQETEHTRAYRSWLAEMEVLVGEICYLCIRRKIVDRMIELPWNRNEERFLEKYLLEIAVQDPSSCAGSLLVVYFIQRCRYPEAYQINKRLCNLEQQYISQSTDKKISEKVENAREWRTHLIGKCVELLPEIQRQELRSGHLSEISFSLSREQSNHEDMETEKEISSIISTAPFASTVLPPVVPQFLDAREIVLNKDTANRFNDFPPASPLGWGSYRQPSILHGKPFITSQASPLLVPSPLLDGVASIRDQERPVVSPIQARSLKYDFDSGKAVQTNESADQISHASDYRLSQEVHNIHKGVPFSVQPSKGFVSGISRSAKERQKFEGMKIAHNKTGNFIENGNSIAEATSPAKGRIQLSIENGFVHTQDMPSTSYLDVSHTSTVVHQERASVSVRSLHTPTYHKSNSGSSGKRQPSDRSWLAGPSDDDFLKGNGGGTGPNSFRVKDHHLSTNYSPAESFHTPSSGVETPKLNGGLRWRSDEGEQEEEQRPASSGRLRGSSGSKGKGIGRSRLHTGSIA